MKMMERMNWKKSIRRRRVFPALLLIAFLMMTARTDTLAAQTADVDREGHLSLEYLHEGLALEGAEFNLYRVGDVTGGGSFVLSGDFANCPVSLKDLDSAGWKAAAGTLAVYASAGKIPPAVTQRTDSHGTADFGILKTGLYLLEGKETPINNTAYRSDPFLVSLPALNEEGEQVYDVTAHPKTVDTAPSWNGELTVIKVWNDGKSHASRPQQIEVTLLKDGAYYDKVTLSADNYWRHTWTGLSGFAVWDVMEGNIEGGYTVTYTKEGAVYTVTNTLTGHTPGGGGDNGGGGGNEGSHDKPPALIVIPDTDVPEAFLETPEEPAVPLSKLPQTGLLWWPVPFLAISGLLMFGFGYKDYFDRKRKNDEK